jgi:hypothetical protein
MQFPPPLDAWLRDLAHRQLVVDEPNAASRNMNIFALSAIARAHVTEPLLASFLVAAYRQIWKMADGIDAAGVFYAWVDELAGQLRCSFAPIDNVNALPFACRVDLVESPEPIAAKALAAASAGPIRIQDTKEVEWPDPDEPDARFELTVYAREVRRPGRNG